MYARILVPIDGTATADAGLDEAIRLAATLNSHLVLLCVVDDFPLRVTMVSAVNFQEASAALASKARDILASARLRASEAAVSCEVVLREVTSQRPSDVIVEEAARHRCDLIVMGTHGWRGMNRLAMGSLATLVLRDTPVPVLLVRGHGGD